MTLLSRDQILSAALKLPTEAVPVPELGGDVLLTMLSANEKLDWAALAYPNNTVDMKQYVFGLVSRSILGEDGEPAFTADEVGSFSDVVVKTLHAAAVKLNAIGAEAVAATEGKSEATPPSSGASD